MTRIVATLLALAVATTACNPATAKDRTSVWTSIEALDDEGAMHGRAVRIAASVDSAARDMESELEITASTTRTEDEQPRLDVYRIQTLGDLVSIMEGQAAPDARASDGSATVALNPNFRACEGEGLAIREDGSCDYEASLLILGDAPRTLFVGGAVKVWAADEWAGDPDSVDVVLEIVSVDVEE